jgi:hypothetical protein
VWEEQMIEGNNRVRIVICSEKNGEKEKKIFYKENEY